MELPGFYDPDRVGEQVAPDVSAAVAEGAATKLSIAEFDQRRLLLLLVDAQIDFVHLDGALSVPGAVADAVRTIEWICRNVQSITAIYASLDSHLPTQIFFSGWWEDEAGEHPDPMTVITANQVAGGRWKPRYLPEWSADYVVQLEQRAKKELMIWPYHTLLATPGHNLTPALYEAVTYHAAARTSAPRFITKGELPQTEYYSLFEPEVKVPQDARGQPNQQLLDDLASFDLIYVAGQARSHCVLESIGSIAHHRPDLLPRVRLLEDCTSSVQHPSIDFDALADERYAEFGRRGMRQVRSTDPV